jgi:hypothetical protein
LKLVLDIDLFAKLDLVITKIMKIILLYLCANYLKGLTANRWLEKVCGIISFFI